VNIYSFKRRYIVLIYWLLGLYAVIIFLIYFMK